MEDRYHVCAGIKLPVSNSGFRFVAKAALGLATLATIGATNPLVDSVMGQTGAPLTSQMSAANRNINSIDAPWIWSPRFDVTSKNDQGEVYFRKRFTLVKPEKAELTLAAGDEFELFINGEMIATGQSFGTPTSLDPSPFLESGVNVVAVRVKHIDSGNVGLAMKMRIKEYGEVRHRVLRTDSSWKSYTAKAYQWHKNSFNAASWLSSKVVAGANAAASTAPKVAMFGTAKNLSTLSETGNLSLEKTSNFISNTRSRVKLQPVAASPSNAIALATRQVDAAKESTQKKAANTVDAANAFASSLKSKIADKVTAPSANLAKPALDKVTKMADTSFAPKMLPQTEGTKDDTRQSEAPPAPIAAAASAKVAANVPVLPALKTGIGKTTAERNHTKSTIPAATAQTANFSNFTSGSSKEVTTMGFNAASDFAVTQVLDGKQTGSLIAMEFNEYGQMLLSKEGGPLLIADTTVADPSKQVRVFCSEVTSCQGILPLNGDVFVTAEGPDGQALYRLSDSDNDGVAQIKDTLVKFTGQPGEHGPHGITLGPDGKIYVVVGNSSRLKNSVSRRSPYQFPYEGDVLSKYEDPAGQATGAAAPGGTVIRVGIDGSRPETVAGGIRNAYDLVFDENGELFIHDSDMEGDRGTSWYRPPMIFNVVDGAELGWRSGWSKFSTHYPDQHPPVCDTGRGSPSGAVLYQHLTFPERYQNSIFFADWSEGKIYSFKKQVAGASFTGTTEVFLSGKPLNVCDLSVGQDGALYFCTGGRGTKGGVYKVAWKGQVPDEVMTFESDLAKVMRHPQPTSAWARQNIAELKRQMGSKWKESILGAISETRNPASYRVQGMQLSVLYGPKLPNYLMKTLTMDASQEVRAQAARMCGSSNRSSDHALLVTMLNDQSSLVRRKACEGLLRLDRTIKPEQLVVMLESEDRSESATARRLLERIDADQWQDELVNSKDIQVFIQSSLALMSSQPTLDRAYFVLAESSKALDGYLSDADFLDVLRVVQVAMAQGKVNPEKIPAFVQRLGEEFPAGSPVINQELVKTLAGLKVGDLDGRIANWLKSPTTTPMERFQAAMYFHRSSENMSSSTRMALASTVADLKNQSGGGSYQGYLQLASQNLGKTLGENSLVEVIAGGDKWPEAVLKAFYKMPTPLPETMANDLKTLDQKLIGRTDHAAKKVRLGIIALLAEQGSEASFSYLRERFDREPARQADIAIGLALQPESQNWSYLVSSLPVIDDQTGPEILNKLASVNRRPKDPVHYRDAIDLGYRLRTNAGSATQLLSHWTGKEMNTQESWKDQMDAWSNWYASEFPNSAPVLAGGSGDQSMDFASTIGFDGNRYTTEQLVGYFETNGLGDPRNGHDLFQSAQCSQCHQMDGQGAGIGPDLTTVSNRFSLREMIEATIEPHKAVDQRFRATTIVTEDGQTVTGLASQQSDDTWLVVTPEGQRVRVDADFVAQVKESKMSTMPEGLIDDLSPAEAADLFGYIVSGGMNNMADNESTDSTMKVDADSFR